jgi:hypothetical protein
MKIMKNELKKLGGSIAINATLAGFVHKETLKPMKHCDGVRILAKSLGKSCIQAIKNVKYPKAVVSAATGVLTLDPNFTEHDGTDYIMNKEALSVWIKVDGFSVYLKRTDEGVVVDVFAHRAENESIASTYAFSTDAESTLCDYNQVDVDLVSEWVGIHYHRNFDGETASARHDWILRYIESHKDEVVAKTFAEEMLELAQVGDLIFMTDGTATYIYENDGRIFNSPEEAESEVLADVVSQVMGFNNLSSEAWDVLSKEQKLALNLPMPKDRGF